MDAYLGWRDQCETVRDAYDRWTAADESDSALAYRVYATALDAEEQAAAEYARLVRRASSLSLPRATPAQGLAVLSEQGQR
jgi:hypothetical protein